MRDCKLRTHLASVVMNRWVLVDTNNGEDDVTHLSRELRPAGMSSRTRLCEIEVGGHCLEGKLEDGEVVVDGGVVMRGSRRRLV